MEELEQKLKDDQNTLVDFKNQEYQNQQKLNSKHQFDLLQMEEKLEKALTENHKLRVEEAQKMKQLEQQKDIQVQDAQRDLYQSKGENEIL